MQIKVRDLTKELESLEKSQQDLQREVQQASEALATLQVTPFEQDSSWQLYDEFPLQTQKQTINTCLHLWVQSCTTVHKLIEGA